jgi:20S proteasome alpha/beta subunit
MTVCIAAICKDGDSPAVVLAADRMQTGFLGLEYEDVVPKILPVTKSVGALLSGDGRKGGQIVNDAIATAKQPGNPTVNDVARIVSAAYANRRRAEVDSVLLGARGLSLDTFYSGTQRQLADQIAVGIDNAVVSYQYGVELLVVGVDSAGAHIVSIGNPGGGTLDCDATGFAAIGGGLIVAMHTLYELRHVATNNVKQTLFRVYAAKKRAETAQGVGAATDLMVVRKDGCTLVEAAMVDALTKAYKEHHEHVAADITACVAQLP